MCGRPQGAKIVHLDAYSTLRPIPVRNLIDIPARQVTTGVGDSPPTTPRLIRLRSNTGNSEATDTEEKT